MIDSFPAEILDFASEAVFSGLSKSARKNLLKETSVPALPELQPKKVDAFIKKYLKRKGTNFNPIMDRRQLNLVGGLLTPLVHCVTFGLWRSRLTKMGANYHHL